MERKNGLSLGLLFLRNKKSFPRGVSADLPLCFIGQKWVTWPLLAQTLARGMNLCDWLLSEDGSPGCTLGPPGEPSEAPMAARLTPDPRVSGVIGLEGAGHL